MNNKLETLKVALGVILIALSIVNQPKLYSIDREKIVNNISQIIMNSKSIKTYSKVVENLDLDDVPKEFVLAVLAVEMNARSPIRRGLEEFLAATWFAITGKVPDFSLGVGQIKPSTAAILISGNPENYHGQHSTDLLQKLTDNQTNSILVSAYLRYLMHQENVDKLDIDGASIVLCEYQGIDHQSNSCPTIYAEVVWAVYQELVQ